MTKGEGNPIMRHPNCGHAHSRYWTGQCVLQDERCFDFEYEIKFLMRQNSRHGDEMGFNSGTEHFCLLPHMTSSMLI